MVELYFPHQMNSNEEEEDEEEKEEAVTGDWERTE